MPGKNWATTFIKERYSQLRKDEKRRTGKHYSLNWLTNYQNQDWDDVQTNT